MKLRYTERAIADLEYIAQFNPSAAITIGSRIKGAIELLEDFPGLGRPGRIRKTAFCWSLRRRTLSTTLWIGGWKKFRFFISVTAGEGRSGPASSSYISGSRKNGTSEWVPMIGGTAWPM
jgi:hypothetical protein